MAATRKLPEGVLEKHAKRCAAREGRRCRPAYQAAAWSPRERRRLYKTFPTPAAAKAWRRDTTQALERGALKAARPPTLREAADEYVAGMRSGAIRASSGDRYKPSVIRGYDQALRKRVVPALGDRRLSEIDRGDLMKLAERMLGEGLDPSTIRNTLMPLRALYRRAVDLGRSPSTRRCACACRESPAGATGSPLPPRRPGCWPPCPIRTARCGRPPSTPACASALRALVSDAELLLQ